MNALQDPAMIDRLYEASQAGVEIDLIAVSYTHLDVYKRQSLCYGLRGSRQQNSLRNRIYTWQTVRRQARGRRCHLLDVYKRQLLHGS